ncbi:MAG: hypothetical protein E7214_01430 [Clostridium sp.]|nr:hypothetical protein [Clostridium sp.]
MNKNLTEYSMNINDSFNEDNYFKNLLLTYYYNDLLNKSEVENILYKRLEVLKDQMTYYTKNESSSINIEDMDELLKSVDFTIGLYLKEIGNEALKKLKEESLSDIFMAGNKLIKIIFEKDKKLLEKIQNDKLKVKNYSYDDTIDYGLTKFFKAYDDFFEAHIAPCDIDYQIAVNYEEFEGTEYFHKYLVALNMENEFCLKFDVFNINELLRGYSNECEMLLLNVFELVLTNALGLIICNKDPRELNISKMDREIIKSTLDNIEEVNLYDELLNYLDRCFEELLISDSNIKNYSKKVLENIASNIKNARSLEKLENLFISFKTTKERYIEYVDGARLSDEDFRKLSDEAIACVNSIEKIKLINKNIKSIEDLIDILNVECLFEDEYSMYFESLDEVVIILLYKYVSSMGYDENFELEWHKKFSEFIKELGKDRIDKIKKLKNYIKVKY